MADEAHKMTNFRMDRKTWEQVRRAALAADLTVSQWLRRAVDEKLHRERAEAALVCPSSSRT